MPGRVDALQSLQGGPCLDALSGGTAVAHAEDLCSETGWSGFTRAVVAQTPVPGILSCRLSVTDDQTMGSLSLYAARRHAFDAGTTSAVRLLGAHAALAWYFLQQERLRNLAAAPETNQRMAIAVGIVMSRRSLCSGAASRHGNPTLRDIAEEVLERAETAGPARRQGRAERHDS